MQRLLNTTVLHTQMLYLGPWASFVMCVRLAALRATYPGTFSSSTLQEWRRLWGDLVSSGQREVETTEKGDNAIRKKDGWTETQGGLLPRERGKRQLLVLFLGSSVGTRVLLRVTRVSHSKIPQDRDQDKRGIKGTWPIPWQQSLYFNLWKMPTLFWSLSWKVREEGFQITVVFGIVTLKILF